jgi:hypothetical protein
MKVLIEIEIGNASMLTWGDVKEAIEKRLRYHLNSDAVEESDGESRTIRDAYGNTVGSLSVESEK